MLNRVSLRPYAAEDLSLLLRLLGDAKMMEHLGGPESADAVARRHERYLAPSDDPQGLFTVLLRDEPAGWVGYWQSRWQDDAVWECGWHVLPEAQGQGVATEAARMMLQLASDAGRHRFVHAFPAVENAPSNALCERLGFEFLGQVEVEYPKGRLMQANDWRFDLTHVRERLDGTKG